MTKNILPASGACLILILIVLGCGGSNKAKNDVSASASPANAAPAASVEKPIALQAKALTKEYDDNELAADGKYKGKQLAVTGKIANIAETLGKISVSLEGHNIVKSVICSFDDAERDAVMKLKKGQTVTLTGTGDGLTLGLYAGMQKCRVQ